MMINVKIQLKHPDAKLPFKGSELAACHDVYATEIIEEGSKVICMLGFSLQPPPNYKVELVPRSNITNYKIVMSNSPGQIDPDFLGEFRVIFTKLNDDPFPYKVGDRVAQIYLQEIVQINFEEVTYLEPTQRGEGGFGSTGLN